MKKQPIIIVIAAAVFLFVAGTAGAGLLDRVVNIAEDAVKKDQPPPQQGEAQNSASQQATQAEVQQSTGLTDTKVYPVSSDEGVVINGVKWATRNVDAPGKFTANPSEGGMFYQWNRKKGWAGSGREVDGWDKTCSCSHDIQTWTKANDPSPAGWRLPTREETESLKDESKVSSEFTTLNGVHGRTYTDKATGNTIFIPAVGSRDTYDGDLKNGIAEKRYWARYWTNSGKGYKESAWYWGFKPGGSQYAWATNGRGDAYSLRPVSAK